MTKKNLKSLYDIVEVRIPQINTALANLKTEILVAQKSLEQVEKSIKKAEDNYEKVEQGKITAAAAFGSANAQISNAENTLKSIALSYLTYVPMVLVWIIAAYFKVVRKNDRL